MSYPRILLRLGLGTPPPPPPSCPQGCTLGCWLGLSWSLVAWSTLVGLPFLLCCLAMGDHPPRSPPDSPLPPKNNTDKVPILISLSLLFISLSK